MPADPVHDFDFFFGAWKVRHRYLTARLAGCSEWIEFGGTCTVRPTMNGAGNTDDNVIDKPDGTYRAMTVRTYDPKTRRWAIWWFDGRTPHGAVDPPMIGAFQGGVGTFLADDTFQGRTIKVRFLWSGITQTACCWEQAFSQDGGASWETNWIMEKTRTA
ncbi:MAG: hypothetical protein WDN08_14650 [Rhizomicrobium sp.]